MKKLTLFFFALLAVCLAFQACDNSKTYAEMLEEEKDAIKAFIKDIYGRYDSKQEKQFIMYVTDCRSYFTVIKQKHRE